MRSRRIMQAYDSIRPSQEVCDEILARIQSQAEKPQKKHILRRTLLIAACIALIGALSAGGFAAYRRWKLPEPETYSITEYPGGMDVHGTEEYTEVPTEETEPLSDEAFIASAVKIMESIGQTEIDTGSITVTRQEDLEWSREEAAVQFTQSENRATVTFNAQTGELLNITDIDWVNQSPAEAPQDPESLARYYYSLLPVPQDYVLANCTVYDEQYYCYDFSHEIMEGLYNDYETVRIAVNPISGRLCCLVVFSVPLLDDHEPGDVPLTQAQAEEIVQSTHSLDGCVLNSAELTVVLPNWIGTDAEAGAGSDFRYSKVARLAWTLSYERPDSEFADIQTFYIDYYTGELLGSDMTG